MMKNPRDIMRLLTALLFTCAVSTCFPQIKLTKLNKSSMPMYVTYTGKIQNAVRWTDNLGDNVVVTTETGYTPNPSGDGSDAALYAYHYLMLDSVKLIWRVYDFIKECMVDMKVNFIKNSFAVTDLDKDGTAEIWLMYKTVCHGDVSPSDMKIIMYEAGKKHAIRGTNRVRVGEKEYMGGEFTMDDAFKKSPAAFRKYAEQLWKKNINETWE